MTQSSRKVTLQINLAPGDYPYAKLIIPHQLTTLSGQVDEILLIIDTRKSSGRFADGWSENEDLLYTWIEQEVKPRYPVRVLPVNYSQDFKAKIGKYFFGVEYMPDKDFRGGPFYSYFFGLYHASHDLVFHLDSDMFLGGASQTWVREAKNIFTDYPQCYLVAPLPGPPHPSGILIDQGVEEVLGSYTFKLKGMSTRIFMIDKALFSTRKINFKKPSLKSQIKAFLSGNPNVELPENLIVGFMEKYGLDRIEFLGTEKGMWSLHPPFRTTSFYENLESIIARIETGDLPENQYGFYDIVDELCDWAEGWEKLKKNRWWKRFQYGKSNQ